MIKNIICSIIFSLLFAVNVFGIDISGNININENVATIELSNVPEDIHALELILTDENCNTDIQFAPNSLYTYTYKKIISESNCTKISIIIDNINSLSYAETINLGSLTFGEVPRISSMAELELVNLQNDLSGSFSSISLKINDNNIVDSGEGETLPDDNISNGNTSTGDSSKDENKTTQRVETTTETTTTSVTTETTTQVTTTTKTDEEKSTEATTDEHINKDENNKIDILYPVVKESNFSDTETHWASEPIKFLADRGIITGMDDNSFEPNKNITRAEFITLLAKMDDININKYKTDRFKDVSDTAWFNPYVDWAYEKGISSGITEDTFEPNSTISREQMAVMIQRFCDYKGFSLNPKKEKINFIDENNIAPYAKDAIQRVQEAGIINGRPNGSFGPKDNATRAEASQMLYVMLQIQ